MSPLCIYHGNCLDGFASAWVVRRALGSDVEFVAGHYGFPPPDVTGRDVLIVDFSYPRKVLLNMREAARSILVLDHHKSAAADLADLPPVEAGTVQRLAVLFDMERSGAGITWDFFNPGKPRPMLVEHVEDRDLWRFKHGETRAVCAALASYDYDFDLWDALVLRTETQAGRHHMLVEGQAIMRRQLKEINELLPVITRQMKIGGVIVPVANLPPHYASEAGNILSSPAPFAATYYDGVSGRFFSLRSNGKPESVDVSAIAERYGGGGHRNAAGFRATHGWEGEP